MLYDCRHNLLPEFTARWKQPPDGLVEMWNKLVRELDALSNKACRAISDWHGYEYGSYGLPEKVPHLSQLDPMPEPIDQQLQPYFTTEVAEATPALPSLTHPEPAPPDNPKGTPADEANVLVRDWLSANLKGNPGSITRDAVAAATGVSTGAVSKTAAWRAFTQRRNADSKPVLREVPLTDAMLANIPANCNAGEIADLIKEQAEDDASDGRRQVKKSHRHERRHDPS